MRVILDKISFGDLESREQAQSALLGVQPDDAQEIVVLDLHVIRPRVAQNRVVAYFVAQGQFELEEALGVVLLSEEIEDGRAHELRHPDKSGRLDRLLVNRVKPILEIIGVESERVFGDSEVALRDEQFEVRI